MNCIQKKAINRMIDRRSFLKFITTFVAMLNLPVALADDIVTDAVYIYDDKQASLDEILTATLSNYREQLIENIFAPTPIFENLKDGLKCN